VCIGVSFSSNRVLSEDIDFKMDTVSRKRKAEGDLKDLEEVNNGKLQASDESPAPETVPPPLKADPPAASAVTSGFAAYAKTNPFQAATAGIKSTFGNSTGGFGNGGFGSSGGFGSGGFGSTGGFGATASSSSTTVESSSAKSTAKDLSIRASLPTTRPNFTMPPPLVVPSPKSPKMNPFSSPSPVHNPFMTIVDSKDELWKTMAKDKLTEEDIVKSNNLQFTRTNSNKRQRTFGSNGDVEYGSEAPQSAEKDKIDEEVRNSTNQNQAIEEGDQDQEDQNDNNQTFESDFIPSKVYAMPENVTIVTGEEEDECLLQTRAKLYRLSVRMASSNTDNNNHSRSSISNNNSSNSSSSKPHDVNNMEWIEVGVGPLKILQRQSHESDVHSHHGRLVMRREDKKGGVGTKLLVNTRLDQYVTVARQGDKMVRVLCVNYADDHHALPASAAGASGGTGGSHNHGSCPTSQHVLLSGLDRVSSPSSSAHSTSASSITAAMNASAEVAPGIVPQTYLFKLPDSKDCDAIIDWVSKFAARASAATSADMARYEEGKEVHQDAFTNNTPQKETN
jgi:hypothetical protein